jgi:hypothetical protein
MTDVRGHPFYNVEVVSLEPASTPPPATPNVVISDVLAYGAGDADPGEYVEIRNDGMEPVPLEDWTLSNATHRTFTFPDYLMGPGESCRIFTNEEHPDECAFTFASDSAVWNDARDCAYLRDDEGSLVDAHCYCQGHTTPMTLSATTTTPGVGEPVTVTAVLFNRGCTLIGVPKYTLSVHTGEPEPILSPDHPDPVLHILGILPGQSDAAQFTLHAVRPGQAVLRASTSFEVHLGYPGPAYWGASATAPLTITVTPQRNL